MQVNRSEDRKRESYHVGRDHVRSIHSVPMSTVHRNEDLPLLFSLDVRPCFHKPFLPQWFHELRTLRSLLTD